MPTTTAPTIQFDTDWSYAPAPESAEHIRFKPQYDLFIGGEFVTPARGGYTKTINPANENTLARIAEGTTEDIDRAVASARLAQEKYWSKLAPSERGKWLFRIARALQERARIRHHRIA